MKLKKNSYDTCINYKQKIEKDFNIYIKSDQLIFKKLYL